MLEVGWNMATYMGIRATQELELLSHNMANANTPGFKQDLLALHRLTDQDSPIDDQGRQEAHFLNIRSRDFSQGGLHATGNDTDFGLDGPGFFKVQTPQGVRYTRNGMFRLNQEWQLVSKEGYPILGKNGPITLNANDQNFYMDQEGGVHMDKSLGDQIAIVDFPNPQGLITQGGNLYYAAPQAGQETEPTNTKIRQGEIEESNFDTTAGMVKLMNIQRGFEYYMKLIDTFTAKDRKVIEEIGTTA
ncbi:MAG: flagellar basal-body rod protein FlgF [Thermodesulfobacteriota bacterium]